MVSTVPKLITSGKFKQEEEVIGLALSSSFLYFDSSPIYLVASERIDISALLYNSEKSLLLSVYSINYE